MTGATGASGGDRDAWVRLITRPHARLFWLYAARSILAGPGFPIVFLILFFRYHTLKYRFGDEGVMVSWGILFYRESTVPYRKIQDIHVRRSFLERWLGIATVDVQTASGSAGAEVQLEGLEDHDAVRDFLYRRMRGTHAPQQLEGAAPGTDAGAAGAAAEAEVVALLRGITSELEQARRALEVGG